MCINIVHEKFIINFWPALLKSNETSPDMSIKFHALATGLQHMYVTIALLPPWPFVTELAILLIGAT